MAIVVSNRGPFSPEEATRILKSMYACMSDEERTQAVNASEAKTAPGLARILHKEESLLVLEIPRPGDPHE